MTGFAVFVFFSEMAGLFSAGDVACHLPKSGMAGDLLLVQGGHIRLQGDDLRLQVIIRIRDEKDALHPMLAADHGRHTKGVYVVLGKAVIMLLPGKEILCRHTVYHDQRRLLNMLQSPFILLGIVV